MTFVPKSTPADVFDSQLNRKASRLASSSQARWQEARHFPRQCRQAVAYRALCCEAKATQRSKKSLREFPTQNRRAFRWACLRCRTTCTHQRKRERREFPFMSAIARASMFFFCSFHIRKYRPAACISQYDTEILRFSSSYRRSTAWRRSSAARFFHARNEAASSLNCL